MESDTKQLLGLVGESPGNDVVDWPRMKGRRNETAGGADRKQGILSAAILSFGITFERDWASNDVSVVLIQHPNTRRQFSAFST